MIPITARILLGRGGDNAALGRLHAGMYFVGIILVYALLGLVASATGGGFNEIMRVPAVILSFAVFFALLGLSMLGLFEIQVPSGVATTIDGATSRRAGPLGTMLMGLGAGLVVSPCVGPVVFAILAQIANQIAAVEAAGGGAFSRGGQLAYGGLLMGAYGAGLGIPFLAVGLFSTRAMVAKPGRWMTLVRVALGVVILYFAFDYFHKALATAGVERPIANAILGGVVLTFLSVLWGVFRPHVEPGPHAGWHRVKHAATLLMLVVGIFYLWTGLTRSGLVADGVSVSPAPVELARGDARAIEDSHGLTWHRDFGTAEALARTESLPIFVDFYAHWCANCKVFAANAAKEGPLRTALERVVRAKVYDTDPVFREFRDDPRFAELKRGLPFFLLLSSDGEFLWKGTDYRAERTFVREIEAALAREEARVDVPAGPSLRADRALPR
jgi:thiol:disulfide interchange protein DsbD